MNRTAWQKVRLADIAEVTAGNPAPQDSGDFAENGEPFVRMQDVGRLHRTSALDTTVDHVTADAVQRLRLRRFPSGSLLIPKSGASVNLNHRALLARDAYVVSHLAVVVPDRSRVLPEFLYYWSLNYDPRHQAQVTSLPSLPTAQIKTAELPVPSRAEQRRIVDILSRAEGIIRLQRQTAEKAREIVPALFFDIFGDPAANSKKWDATGLGDLIEKGPQNGLYKPASEYGEGYPILRIDGFYDGRVTDLGSLRRVRLAEGEAARYALKEGNIVINRVNSPEYLGKSAIVPPLNELTVFESNMMQFSVNQEFIDPRFLIQLLQTPYMRQVMLSRAKHAINQSSINQTDVKSLPVILPPLHMQQAFAERVNDIHSILAQRDVSQRNGDTLFQALLAQAFSA